MRGGRCARQHPCKAFLKPRCRWLSSIEYRGQDLSRFPLSSTCQVAARLLISAKFHPTCGRMQVWCFAELIFCRGRASETNRAPQRAFAMVQATFTGSPCPSPGRGNKPLGGTLEGVRCSAYAISASAGNRAGRTSLRSFPLRLTCKAMCSLSGAMAKSLQRAIRRLPADFNCFAPESRIPSYGCAAFAFLNASRAKTCRNHSPGAGQIGRSFLGSISGAYRHLSAAHHQNQLTPGAAHVHHAFNVVNPALMAQAVTSRHAGPVSHPDAG